MSAKLKIFLMAVIGFVVAMLTTIETFNIAYILIVTVVFSATYAVKNFFLPSDSSEGVANWKDIVSGIIIAVCAALSTFAANLLTDVDFSWKILGVTIIGAVVGYFTKTIPQGVKK